MVAALRKRYGESFAEGRRKDMMLKTLLNETARVRCTTICGITTNRPAPEAPSRSGLAVNRRPARIAGDLYRVRNDCHGSTSGRSQQQAEQAAVLRSVAPISTRLICAAMALGISAAVAHAD